MVNPRFVIKAVLSGQRLNINVPLTVAGTVNYIGVEAKCTSEWDDCTVVCYLYQAGTGYIAQLGLIYDAERKLYYFPNAERLTLTAGEWAVWFVGVMAESGQETYRVTSDTRYFSVYPNPFASSIPSGDISLDEEAIARATDAQNKANLLLDKYNAGELTGPQGEPGDPAEIGFVQASVDNTTGNPGCVVTVTENPENTYNMQFAFSGIKGAKGDTGATGPQGATGAQGAPGRDGTDGRDGVDGQTIDDYVLVQANQPTSETNKMWLKPTASDDPVMIPTAEEFERGKENAYEGANIYPNTVLYGDGKTHNNDLWWSTGLIPVDKTAIAYFHNTKAIITEHTDKTTPSVFKHTTERHANLYYFDDRANYFRVSFPNTAPVGEAGFIAVYDDKFLSVVRPIIQLENPPQSWGRENVLARARHFLDIKWTPVAPFPLCTGSYEYRIVPAGEELTGLPYSSTRNVAKLIGVNISIYTFMTALMNPRSVLYTRKITTGYLGASYYGQHCASFVAYANGDKGCAIDSLGMTDIYSKEISKYELQPGDMLISAQDRTQNYSFLQHCMLVYDITRDKYGRIESLQFAEGSVPFARYKSWEYFSGVESIINQGYKCYRGNTVEATPYELCDFVKGYPDETLPQFVYPDIMPEYGDKACVEAGIDVVINVINPKTYTQIEVYKNGTLIDTRSTISDFTMTNIGYGKYRFVLTDGNNTSESSLIAVAVSGTYDSNTGDVTFSCSNNAKPVAMQSYADESSKPGMGGAHNLEHLFTSEEITNGQANASSITSHDFPNVQVSFLSEYGTAVWSSNPLADQWEYWNPDDLQILKQPLDTNAKVYKQFTMSVSVNKDNVNYQWQYYYNNAWANFQNSNTATLTKTANLGWNGWKIHCIVTDANDPTITVTSREAILRVAAN